MSPMVRLILTPTSYEAAWLVAGSGSAGLRVLDQGSGCWSRFRVRGKGLIEGPK